MRDGWRYMPSSRTGHDGSVEKFADEAENGAASSGWWGRRDMGREERSGEW